MNKRRGVFITFEGLEGSGKSVQVGLLGSKLREEGYTIVVTREPGGTRISEQIRAITHHPENVDLTAVAEAYLMSASRAQHVREIIRPALLDGKIVISDRFLDSSIAYQGYGRELGEVEIFKLNAMAVDDVRVDLTIYLDIPLALGFERRGKTDKLDRLDLQQKDFYERVKRGYEKLIKENRTRFCVIDGTGSIEEVAQGVWECVKPHLSPK